MRIRAGVWSSLWFDNHKFITQRISFNSKKLLCKSRNSKTHYLLRTVWLDEDHKCDNFYSTQTPAVMQFGHLKLDKSIQSAKWERPSQVGEVFQYAWIQGRTTHIIQFKRYLKRNFFYNYTITCDIMRYIPATMIILTPNRLSCHHWLGSIFLFSSGHETLDSFLGPQVIGL